MNTPTDTLLAKVKRGNRLAVVDFIAYVLLAFFSGLAIALTLGGVALLLAQNAEAAEKITEVTEVAQINKLAMKPREAQQGTLLLKRNGATEAIPVVRTEVDIIVSGIVARAHVRQIYRNPYDEWLEGIYVFPLPENAAVDHMRLRVGERVIEGDVKERQAARAEYEQAKSNGQRAALVEQERPNIFTTNVANIPPGGEIAVDIEYQQTVRYDSNRYSLRFPMVVGPRYIPGTPQEGVAGHGWAPNTDQVPDAARITPPVLPPNVKSAGNAVRLRVTLDGGVPLDNVVSAYHRIKSEIDGDGRHVIELAAGDVSANRDFELSWVPQSGHEPQAALFVEGNHDKPSKRQHALLMLMPPAVTQADAHLPREVIFVIDTSGSMTGTSIAQAKEALALAVARLAEQDSFNVIEFNSYAKALYSDAQPSTAKNRARALDFVHKLQAQGGTEMASALNLALNGRENPGRVRQVIFLTDGAVGNEDGLFTLIAQKLGDTRLFTVGIGAAPNSHFMTKAAQIGRGTFTYIGKIEEVKEKMNGLFAKLESPVLKGVEIDWPEGAHAEVWPKRIPDLYLGEPIVVSVALDQVRGDVRISGLRGSTPWHTTLSIESAHAGKGMGVLWAREKIQSLVDTLREGAKEEDVRDAVVAIALEHHLASKYTSLVAVDKTPVRAADSTLTSGAVPTQLPEGWQYEAVFGELPQGATDARWNLLIGTLAVLFSVTLLLRPAPLQLLKHGMPS